MPDNPTPPAPMMTSGSFAPTVPAFFSALYAPQLPTLTMTSLPCGVGASRITRARGRPDASTW
jgi:hypothetical protein